MRQWLIVFSISVGIIYENFVSFTKLCFVAFLPYTINYTTLVYATIFQVLSFSKLTSVKKVWRKKCTKLHTLLSKICMHIEVCICICIYVAAINLNISPFWLWRKFHGWAPAKLLDVFWHFQSSFLSTIAIEKLYASQITNTHTHICIDVRFQTAASSTTRHYFLTHACLFSKCWCLKNSGKHFVVN